MGMSRFGTTSVCDYVTMEKGEDQTMTTEKPYRYKWKNLQKIKLQVWKVRWISQLKDILPKPEGGTWKTSFFPFPTNPRQGLTTMYQTIPAQSIQNVILCVIIFLY